MISILIATKNRSESLLLCLESIFKNKGITFEILILDQSTDDKTQLLIKKIKNKSLRYFQVEQKGKSFGLNIGIKKAKGNILAFTDDDCIVTNNWLLTIQNIFQKDKDIAMLFGKSLPYKGKSDSNLICPAVFSKDSAAFITKPVFHAENIGFGNNMAIKTSNNHLFFCTWLGPGSIGHAAEDAEIALRFLINKKKIKYDSNLLIYHNKWLTPAENFKQNLKYLCGETACYGYFYFQRFLFAKPIIKNNFSDSYQKLKILIKERLGFRHSRPKSISINSTFLELFFRLKGLVIGLFFALKRKPCGFDKIT